jgi:hypothetical protein
LVAHHLQQTTTSSTASGPQNPGIAQRAGHSAHSSSTEATSDRRWSVVAANLDRYVRGEKLENIVLQT